MSVPTLELLAALAEKMALLAAAAVFAVLLPPLRKRLLGQGGESRDKAFGMLFGTALSMWGAMLGLEVAGAHINVRAIGVVVAAMLGGQKAGVLAGLSSGIFMASRVDDGTAPWVVLASATDGIVAGLVAKYAPAMFRSPRVFFTAIGVQLCHITVVGLGLLLVGHAERYLPAWPAHLIKLVVNAAGVMLFVEVSRVVIAREEAAVALVQERAARDQAALESLRRRLEPHFLFNALNALRATIRIDPARARELVSNLSDLYRYLLSHPEDAPLSEEVAHARAYLEIEAVRLGHDRLTVKVELPPEIERHTVPALLLQPLAENAVKHGVGKRTGHGTVTLRARLVDDALIIEVEDDTEGPLRSERPLPLDPAKSVPPPAREILSADVDDEDSPGTGIALLTLRERLEHRYGAAASIVLYPTQRGAIAVVRLPDRESASREAAQ